MNRFQCFNHSLRLVVLFGCLLLLSCEEEFDINVPDNIAKGIVFQGLISNCTPPYFFQLTKPAAISAEDRYYEGIEDASIVIEDVTAGIKDTLILVQPQGGEYSGVYYNYYNYHTQKEDVEITSSIKLNKGRGIYVTTKIYGIEGHTYTLNIYYKGEHYVATETMVPKTIITDLKVQKIDLGGKGLSWGPIISFKNQPGVDNYYLFHVDAHSASSDKMSSINRLLDTSENWSYSIISDEYLNDEVVDLLISDGENVKRLNPGSSYPYFGDTIFVTLESLSRACYDVYDRSIMQLRTDGGAYTPIPTSVKSNISGNVWGMFRVSAYSEKYKLIERGN